MRKSSLLMLSAALVLTSGVAVAVSAKHLPTLLSTVFTNSEPTPTPSPAVMAVSSPIPTPSPLPSPVSTPIPTKAASPKPKVTTNPNALDLHLSLVGGFNVTSGKGVVNIVDAYRGSSYLNAKNLYEVPSRENTGSWLVLEARNNGQEVAKNVVYSVSVDGQVKSTFTKDQIEPGTAVAVALINMGKELAPAGIHSVTVSINPGKTIVESRYDNNSFTFKLNTGQ